MDLTGVCQGCRRLTTRQSDKGTIERRQREDVQPTFPTAASPNNTSLTLLLGLGADELSAIL